MAVTNIVSRRLLSKKRLGGPLFRYSGVVDYVGGRLVGQYIDNKTAAWNNATCLYGAGYSCDCCGNDGPPYYNCNYCNFYSVYVDTGVSIPSSSFSNTSNYGYYDAATNKGFKSLAPGGYSTTHTDTYYTCATNCSGYTETNVRSYAETTQNDFFGENYIAGIKEDDGSLWTWGYNNYGQLGNSSTVPRFSPVQVGSQSWIMVVVGDSFFGAIRSDNTLWAWGYNGYGTLGQNNTVNRSSPVQIAGSWKYIAAGGNNMFGIKTDDTLWGWGYNGWGNVGDNTTTWRSSPVQVSGGGAWKYVITDGNYGTTAIKTNGTAYGWGYNGFYQIGDGSGTQKSSPTLVGGGHTDWTHISIPGWTWRAGVRSNGTAWVWGNSPFGVANLGNRISPIQIGSSTDHVSGSSQANFGGIYVSTIRNLPFILSNGNVISYNGYNDTRTNLYTGGGAVEFIGMFNSNQNIRNGNYIIKYVN